MEVDAGIVVFAAAIRMESAGRFLIVLNLRTTEVKLERRLGLKAGNGQIVSTSVVKVFQQHFQQKFG